MNNAFHTHKNAILRLAIVMEAEHIHGYNTVQCQEKVHSKQVVDRWGYFTPSWKTILRLCFKGCRAIYRPDNAWGEQLDMEQHLQRCNGSGSMAFLMNSENFEHDFKVVNCEVMGHKAELMG